MTAGGRLLGRGGSARRVVVLLLQRKGQGESARVREMASGRRRAWTLATRVWMSEVIHPGEWSETEQGREGSILP